MPELLLPPGLEPLSGAILVIASFFTSALTAAFGIGGGVALIALMGFVLPVTALVPIHGVIQLGSNAGRLWVQRKHVGWFAVLPFLAGSAIGAVAGAGFVVRLDDAVLKVLLGVFILLVTWLKVPALQQGGAAISAIGGLVTTFLTMFFGATGPLTAIFFEKLFADRRAYAASHAAAMTAQHGLKVIAFSLAGFAFAQWLGLMLAMIVSGFAGTLAGSRLLSILPETGFRQIFRWLLTLLALDMVRRGIALWA
ncbi:MAG: sulfite exporter TauE/SafE family protein [Nitratireductor sp.]|nr:sulfite exporter TauE/SafE family protein [Nitratireductor sp.]MCB1460611.1 sulfite exporter TauE/SafE family protein [Nitratireductor sp.]